jgi:predicted DNA-binding transcriptional regulator AlpA
MTEPAPALCPPAAAQAPPLAVSAAAAAALVGISRGHWLRLCSAGRVPEPVRLGRCVRWNVDELKRWIEAGCPGRDVWETLKEARRRR